MTLRISVIVCAHNEARFLGPCLHSLLAQTRTPDEILVIDNASTDETRAVAEQVCALRGDDAVNLLLEQSVECRFHEMTGLRSRSAPDLLDEMRSQRRLDTAIERQPLGTRVAPDSVIDRSQRVHSRENDSLPRQRAARRRRTLRQ